MSDEEYYCPNCECLSCEEQRHDNEHLSRNGSMSINKWRTVGYTDEGCHEYECLCCNSRWESRSDPEWSHWKFCPHCGTHWDGKQEGRPHWTPRWEWDLWGDDGIPYEISQRLYAQEKRRRDKETVFVIEEWDQKDKEWYYESHRDDRAMALKHLKDKRLFAESDFKRWMETCRETGFPTEKDPPKFRITAYRAEKLPLYARR